MTDTGGELADSLGPLGWDADWAAAYAAAAESDDRPGRLARADRGESLVIGAAGPELVASDSQRGQNRVAPATGDWVVVTDDPGLGPLLRVVLDRRTAITRRDPAERLTKQVLAANVDLVGLVVSVDQSVNPARLERFLVLAHDSGADPVIVITKADLTDDVGAVEAEVSAAAPGTALVTTSAVDGTGVGAVHDLIRANRTLVLLGGSGSGKSRLVNALLDDDRQEVGEVRAGDAKGRHTTTTRELIQLPGGGVIIDTPGVRAVGVWDAAEALDVVFDDISELATGCRFRDCTHSVEPGCAVLEGVAEGRVDPARLERYHALVAELDGQQQAWTERGRRTRRR